MVAVIQRVAEASVKVNGSIVGHIGHGLCLLLGVMRDDTRQDADFLVRKIIGMRLFSDDDGKMNLSLDDVRGSLLAVSQFTLCADWLKGRRPGFANAAGPQKAEEMYDYVCREISLHSIHVERGIFAADMSVSLTNEGPVTFVLDSYKKFKR